MKDFYPFKNRTSVFIASILGLLLVSCGTYQPTSYDDDGIYNSQERVIVTNDVTPEENNSTKYYEDYFSKNVNEYGEIEDNHEAESFTDVENYSSQNNNEAAESYSSWEDSNDNVTINVYNTSPFYYDSYYRPFNYWNRRYLGFNYGYADFYCGFNSPYSYGGFYNNYYGYNPYYYGYNQPYYYNNSYYGRSKLCQCKWPQKKCKLQPICR